jgi:hypothetical protein
MKSAVFNNYHYLPEVPSPVLSPVLTQPVQQELNQLLASLRKQVRNVVAVGLWWERRQQGLAADLPATGQLPHLQVSRTEELSFQLKASPEAFALFTKTLLQTSFYLHENARMDAGQQVLKVRVDFRNLAAWEYELSVLFEQITPASYLNTLRYDRQRQRLPERAAS